MKTKDIKDQDFEELLNKQLNGIETIELMVLKGQILIAYSINKFIADTNESNLDIDKVGFTFSNKIKVAELLGLFNHNDRTKESINIVNKIRNQIAHQLTFDDEKLQDLLKIYIKLGVKGGGIDKTQSDLENLRGVIIAICGLVMGKKIGREKSNAFTKQTLMTLRSADPKEFDKSFKNFHLA